MTITGPHLLASIPAGLRDPLFSEYQQIVQNFMERRWSPAELSGGRFCEVVFTVLDGHAKGVFASAPSKPGNFVGACRSLESNTSAPRSFQILIPRLLPALYEIRNNRGVGHVGGDVDPNSMDASAVVSISSWVLAELVRVFHDLKTEEAEIAVNAIAERRIPIVWSNGVMKRILDTKLNLPEQILVFAATSQASVKTTDLEKWTEVSSKAYLMRVLRGLHKVRQIELDESTSLVAILPPGAKLAENIVAKNCNV
jgi:hypothetical protein